VLHRIAAAALSTAAVVWLKMFPENPEILEEKMSFKKKAPPFSFDEQFSAKQQKGETSPPDSGTSKL
jgi:hypothetical protein